MNDALILARAQFAFTMTFHIVFPSMTIGLASYLAVLEGLWLRTGKAVFLNLFKYWLKIFAVVFGSGVVSGLVMSYQFGSNWSVGSDKAGAVIGPLMAYEVMTAFFLEAGFLGVMLFGLERVGKPLHFVATVAVALGTLTSAFWILAANSWMQTPAGFLINVQGQFVPTDWLRVIFNPSFPFRLAHMVLAAYLTTALVVGGVGGYHLLRDRRRKDGASAEVRTMFSMALWMATLVAPIQIFAGDTLGLNSEKYQPVKIMAAEGHFKSYAHGAPLVLFGLPDERRRTVDDDVSIPKLSSLIIDHDIDAPMAGLNTVPRDALAHRSGGVLELPDHGRSGLPDGVPRIAGLGRALAAAALRLGLASSLRGSDGPLGLRGRHRRLGDDRGRASAVCDLWHAAHQPGRVTVAGAGARRLARRICRGLFHRVWGRRLLHTAADGP